LNAKCGLVDAAIAKTPQKDSNLSQRKTNASSGFNLFHARIT
jgi:hypothetical protein